MAQDPEKTRKAFRSLGIVFKTALAAFDFAKDIAEISGGSQDEAQARMVALHKQAKELTDVGADALDNQLPDIVKQLDALLFQMQTEASINAANR